MDRLSTSLPFSSVQVVKLIGKIQESIHLVLNGQVQLRLAELLRLAPLYQNYLLCIIN